VLTGMTAWMVLVLSQNALDAYRTGEGSGLSAWNPKVWPYRVIYAVGFGLFALQCFAKTIENVLIALGRVSQDGSQ
jgi:TRAP-type mannitol/chloroaromatic compound transport system permease small subunit